MFRNQLDDKGGERLPNFASNCVRPSRYAGTRTKSSKFGQIFDEKNDENIVSHFYQPFSILKIITEVLA
jgi:hypothetical protein